MTEPQLPELPPSSPPDADEQTNALWFLDFYRTVFERKVIGLSDEQARTAACPPSELTVLGLVRHMADVERGWFRRALGEDVDFLLDYSVDPDIEFHPGPEATLAPALELWRGEVASARANLAAADLDHPIERSRGGEDPPNLRWVVIHMIEEYARHCGHLDLITQALDGRTGD